MEENDKESEKKLAIKCDDSTESDNTDDKKANANKELIDVSMETKITEKGTENVDVKKPHLSGELIENEKGSGDTTNIDKKKTNDNKQLIGVDMGTTTDKDSTGNDSDDTDSDDTTTDTFNTYTDDTDSDDDDEIIPTTNKALIDVNKGTKITEKATNNVDDLREANATDKLPTDNDMETKDSDQDVDDNEKDENKKLIEKITKDTRGNMKDSGNANTTDTKDVKKTKDTGKKKKLIDVNMFTKSYKKGNDNDSLEVIAEDMDTEDPLVIADDKENKVLIDIQMDKDTVDTEKDADKDSEDDTERDAILENTRNFWNNEFKMLIGIMETNVMDVDGEPKSSENDGDSQLPAKSQTDVTLTENEKSKAVTAQQLIEDKSIWADPVDDDDMVSLDSDDQFRSEGFVSFTVHDIWQYKYNGTQILSPPIYVRLLPWCLMVMFRPKGMGLFLKCNGDNVAKGWSCNATAKFSLLRHNSSQPPYCRHAVLHSFYQKENDFGFASYVTWEELADPHNCFVYKDSITVEVVINAEIPYGIIWDSKKHTGFVGLKNQGATCYINSLLQSLYFTNALRRVVYSIPTEADDSSTSFCLSLQRIFYDLQFRKFPVSTERLTKAFGWNTSELLLQHDVQEFLRVLLDKLEMKMKDTLNEGSIAALFEGKSSSYLYCKNVDYNSTHFERFYDIQLTIKGNKDIYESFRAYITTETLEGDNKYSAGEHGLQEAIKGVIFHTFPPVLHLHLCRFQYDPILNCSNKNNDYFEFYEHINLDSYLSEAEETPADYILQAVLVHIGDSQSGHYVAFISPKANDEWFKFDDDVVSKCKKSEAVEQNFGGAVEDNQSGSSAYMLVYIRKSVLDGILADLPESDISLDLIERLEMEKRMDKALRKIMLDPGAYITVSVLLEEMYYVHDKKWLFDASKVRQRLFTFKVTQTIDEMIDTYIMAFGVARHRMRVWNMSSEESQYFTYLDFEAEASRCIDEFVPLSGTWFVFLQFANPLTFDLPLPSFNAKFDIMLFLKFYNPHYKNLTYIGCCQKPLSSRLSELIPEVNKRLGFDKSTPLDIIDEESCLKFHLTSRQLREVFGFQRNYQQGVVLVFEKKHSDNSCAAEFITDLNYRINVRFTNRNNIAEPDIIIELSQHDYYTDMAEALADRLDTEPSKLLFFLLSNSTKALPHTYNGILTNIFEHSKELSPNPRLFYEKLDFHVHELETKNQYKCIWYSPDFVKKKHISVLMFKDRKVRDLLKEVVKQIPLENAKDKNFVILKVCQERIMTIYTDDTPLAKLVDSITSNPSYLQHFYQIEEVPAKNLFVDEMLVPVGHFSRDILNSFGVPFLVRACHYELYGDVLNRIQKRLKVPDVEWQEYKFSVVEKAGHVTIVDGSSIVDLKVYRKLNLSSGSFLPYFGLNHSDGQVKRQSSSSSSEKALKIYT